MKNDKKKIWSWVMNDWGNSAFSTTVMSGFFPVFFKKYWSAGADVTHSTFQLGLANSIASVIVAMMAPILGAIADQGGIKRRFLILFTFLGVIMTLGLSLVGQGEWQLAMLLYVLASIGFNSSFSFYDSQLVDIVTKDKMHFVSALGYSMGYLGGGILFAFNIFMTLKPEFFGFADKAEAIKMSFATVGVWWLIFAIPLFIFVKDEHVNNKQSYGKLISSGFKDLFETAKEIKQMKILITFLIGYWFYIDGVGTIVRMAVDYGVSLGFEATDLMTALLITQFVGFPSAIVFGHLGNKIGPKRGIFIALAVYISVTIYGYFMTNTTDFYVLAIAIGLVQGGIQSLSRSVYAQLVPEGKSTKYFGFYNMLGKFAAVMGPMLMGLVAYTTGSNRISILSLIFLFGIGAFFLAKTDINKGIAEAKTT